MVGGFKDSSFFFRTANGWGRQLSLPILIIVLPILLFFMMFGLAVLAVSFVLKSNSRPEALKNKYKGFKKGRRQGDGTFQKRESAEIIDTVGVEVRRLEKT